MYQNQIVGDDFTVESVENLRGEKQLNFSHQQLVMTALSRCSEAGSHEMRSGFWNEKTDMKGNTIKVYIEDTRNKFISCVKSAMMIMNCDYDDEAKEKINKLLQELEQGKKELLGYQMLWWSNLTTEQKRTFNIQGIQIIPAFFNTELGWYQQFTELKLEIYIRICTELNNLTKRVGFYQTESFEA